MLPYNTLRLHLHPVSLFFFHGVGRRTTGTVANTGTTAGTVGTRPCGIVVDGLAVLQLVVVDRSLEPQIRMVRHRVGLKR